MGLNHKFLYKPSVTVEAAHMDGAVEWDSVSKSKDKACGRSKIEKQKKKIIAIVDYYPFNSSIKRKCTGLK